MGSYNPSAPCAIGCEWMPWQDSVAFMDSERKVFAPALLSSRAENIRAVWFALCARFSKDGVFGVEILDIDDNELPEFSELETGIYVPANDLYRSDQTFALGPFSGFDGTEDDLWQAVNNVGDYVEGSDPLGVPSYHNSMIFALSGGRGEWAGSLWGINGDFAGRWITTVRVTVNVFEAVVEQKEPAVAVEGYLMIRGKKFGGGQKVLDKFGFEGADQSWEWFANPFTGQPWKPSDLNRFDAFLGDDADGIGVTFRESGDSNNVPCLVRARMEVISAPTDERIATGALAPATRQGWVRMPIGIDEGEGNWPKEDGKKYGFFVRKTKGALPLALCRIDEPDFDLPGIPQWTSFEPETSALDEVNPSARPRRLGPESSICYGIALEKSDGSFSLDSQVYASTSPTQGPDAWPFIGAFFDLSQVNENRTIRQDFIPAETRDYGWLQLRIAQVSNVIEDDLIAKVYELADVAGPIVEANLVGTWRISTDDLVTPKRTWQRVGKRCEDATPPTLTGGTPYAIVLTSDAAEDVGWLAQVLNGGTDDGPPKGPPVDARVANFGGSTACLRLNDVVHRSADLEFVLSTMPPAPQDLLAVHAGEACGIDYAIVSWVDPGGIDGCGLTFLAWEVQRSDDDGATWTRVSMPTDRNVVSIDDGEVPSNREVLYRARTVREDGAKSDWSNEAAVTAFQTTPGLVFFSNIMPELAAFALDLEEVRSYKPLNGKEFKRPAGRKFQIALRELADRGISFSTTILVRAGTQMCTLDPCYEYGESGMSVFEPLLRLLMQEALPYVCVRNEAGDRWFAAIETPGLEWRRGLHTGQPDDTDDRGNYTMSIVVTPVTDRPYAPDAALGFGSGSGAS